MQRVEAVPVGEAAQPARLASEPGTNPNIVLISIDSLRADHLGCYGYPKPTTPGIDRLASEGLRFENAVSTTSWTLPSHASMFTGLYSYTHGLVDNGLRLGDDVVTLAEVLAGEGTPIDDMRSSAAFRKAMLGQSLRKLFHSPGLVTGAGAPSSTSGEAS